jgi:hypothetical protein
MIRVLRLRLSVEVDGEVDAVPTDSDVMFDRVLASIVRRVTLRRSGTCCHASTTMPLIVRTRGHQGAEMPDFGPLKRGKKDDEKQGPRHRQARYPRYHLILCLAQNDGRRRRRSC